MTDDNKLYAGLDVGSLYTKAAVVQSGHLVGWAVAETGESCREAANQTLTEALAPMGATMGELAGVLATGAGLREVDPALQARQATPVLALARGAAHRRQGAAGVIDLGGESTHVVKTDPAGQVLEFARNDKCAAGTGIFLDAMADLMRIPVKEMGPRSLEAEGTVDVSSTCVVFAESEVVSAIHRQTPKEDILHGIHHSIATRIHGLMNRIGLEAPVVAVGGLALNIGIVKCLEDLAGHAIVVPDEPRVIAAMGAALLAAEGKGTLSSLSGGAS
jgi:(R)-2-hydroxyacyl-CoA dehydratese activating ATPase